ncbi:DEAD-box protein abstrakt, putative [Prunus dulcis]|uniref:DEAD-box protein abstrakt, putative n=1 Tax=Prunus dulcis TaxID=3755 RepID=A0A4Y1QY48_PRUDU|nr:DEAD-box protein abstrakt, putative [Prunus dulcis]
MPTQILNFTKCALLKHVTVNTGTAGTANLSVHQQVVLVQEESKNVCLLECLQKTAPPILIYCVDGAGVLYFLLIKGVEAVGIHAGMDQKESVYAISSFKAWKKMY